MKSKYKRTRYGIIPVTTEIDESLVNTTVLMEGLGKAATGIRQELAETFKSAGGETDRFSQSVSKAKKALQADLQEMRSAFSLVAEPVGRLVIPVLDQMVQKVTGVVQSIGLVLSALMGIDTATKKVKAAAKAEETLKKTSVSTAAAVKRSLAGFDQINRLNGPSGGTGSKTYTTPEKEPAQSTQQKENPTLTPQLQAVVDKILALIEPLKTINFTPIKTSLEALGTAFSGLGSIITQSLQWAWFEILVPLGKWMIEAAGPATVDVLTAAFTALSAALAPVLQGIQNLKVYLEPVVKFIGESVIEILGALQLQFQNVAQVFREKGLDIQETFRAVGQTLALLWEQMRPIMELIRALWVGVIDTLGTSISGLIRSVIEVFAGLVTFISGVLSGNWEQAWSGLKKIFYGFVNGVIGAVNGLISGVVNGINAIIRALNQVHFTLPNWDVLGKLAGKSYGISLRTISAPQIPYLAQGAVLPANKPFLAMVGDQRHGTNVEAPLATIQEAVALVMDDMIASNLAGQEMIVGVLRELLEAVLGIRVGDEVIGRAVERYNRKMAVVKGGYV